MSKLLLLLSLGILAALCARGCETALAAGDLYDTTRAITFSGTGESQLGQWVSSAGDVDGDGIADVVISAPFENLARGCVYVVFGRSAAEWEADAASGEFDFNVSETPDAQSWVRVSTGTTSQSGLFGVAHGDFNGDGVDDLLMSENSGHAYVLFGHDRPWQAAHNSSNMDVVINGALSSSSIYVGCAGDMNGDGIADILVSETDSSQSAAYVIFGANILPSSINVIDLNGTNGFSLTDGTASLGYGFMTSPGDVNGDGIADLALGSWATGMMTGRAYVVFGRDAAVHGPWSAQVDVTQIGGTAGFSVKGSSIGMWLGWTVTGAGDINGDGLADVFIGTYGGSDGAWIVFGSNATWPTTALDVSSIDGTNGFHFEGEANSYFGISGGGAGDVNGDGVDDLVIAGDKAYGYHVHLETGAAAVVFGRRGPWPAAITRSEAVGSLGFQVDGLAEHCSFGQSAFGAGDVNNDGLADIIIGAPFFNSKTGFATLVFGIKDNCITCSNATRTCITCETGYTNAGAVCVQSGSASALPSSCHGSGGGVQSSSNASGGEGGGGGGDDGDDTASGASSLAVAAAAAAAALVVGAL